MYGTIISYKLHNKLPTSDVIVQTYNVSTLVRSPPSKWIFSMFFQTLNPIASYFNVLSHIFLLPYQFQPQKPPYIQHKMIILPGRQPPSRYNAPGNLPTLQTISNRGITTKQLPHNVVIYILHKLPQRVWWGIITMMPDPLWNMSPPPHTLPTHIFLISF